MRLNMSRPFASSPIGQVQEGAYRASRKSTTSAWPYGAISGAKIAISENVDDDEESDDRELVASQASPGVGPQAALLARGQLPTEPDRRRVALPRSDRVLDQVLDFPRRSGQQPCPCL